MKQLITLQDCVGKTITKTVDIGGMLCFFFSDRTFLVLDSDYDSTTIHVSTRTSLHEKVLIGLISVEEAAALEAEERAERTREILRSKWKEAAERVREVWLPRHELTSKLVSEGTTWAMSFSNNVKVEYPKWSGSLTGDYCRIYVDDKEVAKVVITKNDLKFEAELVTRPELFKLETE